MTWFALSNNIFDGDAGSAAGISFVSRTIQSLLLMSFAPSSTTLPLYVTVTQCLRKYTPHPASVSCTTDISDRDANPGMTWPILTTMGSCGRLSSRTCVDFSVEPSGIVTVTGFVAGVTFLAVVRAKMGMEMGL